MTTETHNTDTAAHTETDTGTDNASTANPQNDYRWTPATMRVFIEALACTGSVTSACREAGKSPRAAYTLRFRADGGAFALGWDAAIQIARIALADILMDRVIHGYEEETIIGEDGKRVRTKVDNRLGMNLLSRLDRMAEAQAGTGNGARQTQVQLVMQDFDTYLDLISAGGTGSHAATFCLSREQSEQYIIDGEEEAIERELKRISEEKFRKENAIDYREMTEMAPAEAVGRLWVWHDGIAEGWRTNFPVPQDYDGYDDLEESGEFGDHDYQRRLTEEEAALQNEVRAKERAPWMDAAHAARQSWFDGLDIAA